MILECNTQSDAHLVTPTAGTGSRYGALRVTRRQDEKMATKAPRTGYRDVLVVAEKLEKQRRLVMNKIKGAQLGETSDSTVAQLRALKLPAAELEINWKMVEIANKKRINNKSRRGRGSLSGK